MRAAPFFNAPVAAVAVSPFFGGLVSRNIAMLTYKGRRTGREYSTPVGYRRTDGGIRIDVRMADAKTWWRNFLGDGGPVTLRLDGTNRTGHAVAQRDEDGRVSVTVRLTE